MPLSILSAVIYLSTGKVNITDALPFLPSGLIGAFVGAKLMNKIPENILRKIFGMFILYAAVKMFI